MKLAFHIDAFSARLHIDEAELEEGDDEGEHDEETCMVEDCLRCEIAEVKEHRALAEERQRFAEADVRAALDARRGLEAAHKVVVEEMRARIVALENKAAREDVLAANRRLISENNALKQAEMDTQMRCNADMGKMRERVGQLERELTKSKDNAAASALLATMHAAARDDETLGHEIDVLEDRPMCKAKTAIGTDCPNRAKHGDWCGVHVMRTTPLEQAAPAAAE